MADSTHLNLPYIDANQAQKHVTHNEAVRLLDALVQMAVISRTLTAPPGSPADGNRYIVASGGTGAWAGWDLNIAYYVDGAWTKLVPQAGWIAWVESESTHLRWSGSTWGVVVPGGGTSSQLLKGDGSWGTAGTSSIAANAVTNTKLADMAQNTIKGRVSTGSGDPEDLTADQVKGILGIVTRIASASGPAGTDLTWQALTADASESAASLTTVMTTTGVGAGTWAFKYMIRYQSAATTTGLSTAVNHTGTASAFVSQSRHITTGGAAATGVGDQVAATNAGQLMEGKAERALNTASSATAGVDTANADMLLVLEGIVVVTASGDLELKVATEVAASAITVKAGTLLDLRKVA